VGSERLRELKDSGRPAGGDRGPEQESRSADWAGEGDDGRSDSAYRNAAQRRQLFIAAADARRNSSFAEQGDYRRIDAPRPIGDALRIWPHDVGQRDHKSIRLPTFDE